MMTEESQLLHAVEEGNKIVVRDVDELRDTFVTIGCYRETSRLDRCLRTFQKALTLARADGLDLALIEGLRSIHDHKGTLTVAWRNASSEDILATYVDQAWADEGEVMSEHFVAPQEAEVQDNILYLEDVDDEDDSIPDWALEALSQSKDAVFHPDWMCRGPAVVYESAGKVQFDEEEWEDIDTGHKD